MLRRLVVRNSTLTLRVRPGAPEPSPCDHFCRDQPERDQTHHRRDARPRRPRRLLQDHRARLDRGPGGPRRRRHVLHDGLHHRAQPADPRLRARTRRRVPRRRQRPEPGSHRGRHRAGRRRADHPHGRRRQLPAGPGDRPGPQRLRRLLDRPPDDLGRRDGPGGPRGPASSWCWCSPGSGRRSSTPSRPAQDRDLGRHRPVHRADRLRRRRLRPPDPRRRRPPCRSSSASTASWPGLAGAGVRGRPRAGHRPVGAQGQGRDPHLDRGHHGARDHRRGDRRHRPASAPTDNPKGWYLNVPACPDDVVDVPDFACSASSTCSARSSRVGVVTAPCSSSRCCWPTSSTRWAR